MSDEAPIAVVVLGGYLGAGKTTLVNHLLRTSDRRTVVLVNDFGDLAIDTELIESSDGDTVTLANGCVCCSLVDGFAATLAEIRDFDPRPERLVIETSGVADPAAVAAYAHRKGFRLDLVLVLADAEQIDANLADAYVGETVARQLNAADVVVLNKVDLVVDPSGPDATVRSVVGDRPIVHTTGAELDPAVLDSSATASELAAVDAVHAGFETWTATWPGPVARDALLRHVAELPAGVVRVKGFVETDEGTIEIHRVGPRTTITPTTVAVGNRLVAIGVPGAIIERDLVP
ncbi:MAG: GTP-binding protein [Actinomycetota bacterium]